MFPRTSSFDPSHASPGVMRARKQADSEPPSNKGRGPSHEELDRWYHTLTDLLDRELDGDTNHTEDLTNLRDEIYVYLY